MNDPQDFDISDPPGSTQAAEQARRRAIGSPLPVGGAGRTAPVSAEDAGQASPAAPPHGRALPGSTAMQGTGLERAIGALRLALPFVQKVLPILDGNLGAAVSNILTPRPQAPPPLPAQVDLEPIENSLADLRTQHRDLRMQVGEQVTSLKRVEDQLEMVREATDRNTLEQQELLEDLKTVGNKVNIFALIALALLGISIFINLILFLHIRRVLP